MTPEQKQIIRARLLRQLDDTRLHVDLPTLAINARLGGFRLTDGEVERELEYLIAKGFVSISTPAISHGLKLYRITAAGTEYVEANG